MTDVARFGGRSAIARFGRRSDCVDRRLESLVLCTGLFLCLCNWEGGQ